MAYSTKIKEPAQDPIVLFEVDMPLENTIWINEAAGIWKKNLTPGTVTVIGSNGEVGFYGKQNTIVHFIQSMRVDAEQFTKVNNYATLETTNKSFYYSGTTIRVHFDQFNPPYVYENIILGATSGWCNRVDPANDGLYNGVVYDSRLISVPDVKRKKDFLFYGLLQYPGGSVVLQNVDGELDSLKDASIMSQASRFLVGFAGDAYTDFKLFSGFFVDDYRFNFDEFEIEIVDIRKRLSRTLPVAQFDATTYTDINEKNIGENIPMPIGQVYDAPVLCINDEEGGAPLTYTFVLAYIGADGLTQYGVKAGQTIVVRIDGEDSKDTVTLDAAAGTFTLKFLNTDIVTDAWISGDYDHLKHRGKVTVDFIGYVDIGNNTVENNLDVLKLVVSEFLGISYIADNYNTVEWAAEQAGVYDIGKFINKDLEVSELIEMCCTTEDGVYLIQDDGKITFRTSDDSKAISLTIYGDELLTDPEIDPRTNEYLSSVIIAYAKQEKEKRFLKQLNNTYERAVLNSYGRYKQRTIETLLTNTADAIVKAEAVMLSSKTIPIIVEIETGLQTSELEIFDTINAVIDRPDKTLFGTAKYEVLGVAKRLLTGRVGLTLKYVEAA